MEENKAVITPTRPMPISDWFRTPMSKQEIANLETQAKTLLKRLDMLRKLERKNRRTTLKFWHRSASSGHRNDRS